MGVSLWMAKVVEKLKLIFIEVARFSICFCERRQINWTKEGDNEK